MNVLIVDDSSVTRMVVSDQLRELNFINYIETAPNGKIALEKLKSKNYDLVILDVEMPVMNGISFLKEKKSLKNAVPVLILSSLTKEGAEITFQCLELGATDFIPKPTGGIIHIEEIKFLLHQKITNIYELKVHQYKVPFIPEKEKKKEISSTVAKKKKYEFIFIGSSTGGPRILIKMLPEFPENFPLPIIVIQHMPEFFTAAFAERLNSLCKLTVKEAEEGLKIEQGVIIVAKGNHHLIFEKYNESYYCKLNQEPKFNSFRPSIDVSLNSLIQLTNGNLIGIIMTGMGRDGVESFSLLKKNGGLTISQNEESSVIFGMNRRAIESGAIDVVLSDDQIVNYLLKIIDF